MRVVYSPTHLLHDPAFEIASGERVPAWEVSGRAESILAALAADPAFAIEEPTEHGLDPVLAVHDADLVRFLEHAWADWRAAGGRSDAIAADTFPITGLRATGAPARRPGAVAGAIGAWCFDTATPLTAGSWVAARAAADVALSAADAVLDGDAVAYGLCRPPGHHAGRAYFGGYCFLNNAAIAVSRLVAAGAGRVGILDVDFHHGNGTQEIFWDRADVPYASIHGDPDRVFPYYAGYADETGSGAGAGATINQPLPAGVDDAAYLEAVDRALEWLAGRTDGITVVSLGIDTYGLDPICDFALTSAAYHEVGRRAAAAGDRLVVLQEGGYYVPHLGDNVRQWLRGAAGLAPDLLPRRVDGPTAAR